MAENDREEQSKCSFCGRGEDQTVRLISGVEACICSECVNMFAALLDSGEAFAVGFIPGKKK